MNYIMNHGARSASANMFVKVFIDMHLVVTRCHVCSNAVKLCHETQMKFVKSCLDLDCPVLVEPLKLYGWVLIDSREWLSM